MVKTVRAIYTFGSGSKARQQAVVSPTSLFDGVYIRNAVAYTSMSTDIPRENLKYWVRADLGLTMTGSNVSAWADLSGYNQLVTQSIAASMPLLQASKAQANYLPSLRFDGTDDCFNGNQQLKLGTDSHYTIVVARTYNSSSATHVSGRIIQNRAINASTHGGWYIRQTASTGPNSLVNSASGVPDNFTPRAITEIGATAAAENGSLFVYEVIWDNPNGHISSSFNGGTFNVDRSVVGTIAGQDIQGDTPLTLGCSGDDLTGNPSGWSQFLDGAIAEIIQYRSPTSIHPSGNIRLNIHAYLNERYGFSL